MLADTHILIWALEGQRGSIGPKTWAMLQEKYQSVAVSSISLLEIKLKQRRGKLTDIDTSAALALLKQRQVPILEVTAEQAIATATAKNAPHADPFDLLLVAQAQEKQLPLITCDKAILALQLPGLKLIDARQ